jgi:hypothetical protein
MGSDTFLRYVKPPRLGYLVEFIVRVLALPNFT